MQTLDEAKPGFVEVDLVGHDGGNGSGDFAQSLNFIDIATSWDETVACKNKAQVNVFEAIKTASERFPFEILGIDSDKRSEFINAHILAYCVENKLHLQDQDHTRRMIPAMWSRKTTLW